MTRILWIAGLALALFVFGAFLLGAAYALITRHHLNPKGWIILLGNGYIVRITFWYLRLKIEEKPLV